jgi:hypothetical protein
MITNQDKQLIKYQIYIMMIHHKNFKVLVQEKCKTKKAIKI